jgi:hypothetical protein
MRYRLKINKAEYFAAMLPTADGILRLINRHSHGPSGHGTLTNSSYYPYLLLIPPLLLYLRHFYCYVELTPLTLEYRALWRHRSIRYQEIERIAEGVRVHRMSDAESIEVYGYGMKKLSLILDKPEDFITELKQYAPQARLEEPAFQ